MSVTIRVCLGDGAGGFTCSDVSTDSNFTLGVALGLVNADSNLDAVFSNISVPNRVCFGNGAGGFTSCADVSTDTNSSLSVALGLVDGDSNLDAVFANVGLNRVCLGDGAGGFTCSDTDSNASTGVALGDVNNDSNLDAVFANVGLNRVCLGDGAGGFTCSDVSTDTNNSRDVALGDVNNDSNLDAVFANGDLNRVCLGDGAGGFSCSDVSTDTNNSTGVALGNFDPTIDHFKCYKATREIPKFEELDVNLSDQFEVKDTTVKNPVLVCNPVDKDGEGIINSNAHLVCYNIRDVRGQPKFEKREVLISNQFGDLSLQVGGPDILCVPSEKIELGP